MQDILNAIARMDALNAKEQLTTAEADELYELAELVSQHRDVDKAFRTGDRVSWDVGSDVYVGTVARATQTRIYVVADQPISERKLLFTRRQDGFYREHGATNYGRLKHGGAAHMSPEF